MYAILQEDKNIAQIANLEFVVMTSCLLFYLLVREFNYMICLY